MRPASPASLLLASLRPSALCRPFHSSTSPPPNAPRPAPPAKPHSTPSPNRTPGPAAATPGPSTRQPSSLINSLFPEDTPKYSPRIHPPINQANTSGESTCSTTTPRHIISRASRQGAGGARTLDPDTADRYGPRLGAEGGGRKVRAARMQHGLRMLAQRGETGREHRITHITPTVVLKRVGTTFLESDVRRLIPPKTHLTDFKDDQDLIRVIPNRHLKTFYRLPEYSLVFPSRRAAESYLNRIDELKPLTTLPNVTIPPGRRPVFIRPGEGTNTNKNWQESILLSMLYEGGSSPGACVLLMTCGRGGRTKDTGRLPRTEDIRRMLEEDDFEMCPGNRLNLNSGVLRLLEQKDRGESGQLRFKKANSVEGAESKWLLRFKHQGEAHRMVREWHGRRCWEGGSKFWAEVVY